MYKNNDSMYFKRNVWYAPKFGHVICGYPEVKVKLVYLKLKSFYSFYFYHAWNRNKSYKNNILNINYIFEGYFLQVNHTEGSSPWRLVRIANEFKRRTKYENIVIEVNR